MHVALHQFYPCLQILLRLSLQNKQIDSFNQYNHTMQKNGDLKINIKIMRFLESTHKKIHSFSNKHKKSGNLVL